ncbi:MAG TPA: GNAT family N-acetyltransferase, partial [Kiloniellaceae bacterium]
MDIHVRAVELRDRARLIDLYQVLNRHEDRVTGDRRTDRAAAVENLEDSMARLVPVGGLFLVAEVDGAVAGLITLDFKLGPVYVRPELRAHAHIVELVVDPARQRQGIGRALMAAAE